MGRPDVPAASEENDDGGTQSVRRTDRARGREFTSGLEGAVGAFRDELREQDVAARPVAPAPRRRRARRASVLRLPIPPGDASTADAGVEADPQVTAALAPLVLEVDRLRAEIARIREPKSPPAAVAPLKRSELVRLLIGITVSFILVAIALVIVVKA